MDQIFAIIAIVILTIVLLVILGVIAKRTYEFIRERRAWDRLHAPPPQDIESAIGPSVKGIHCATGSERTFEYGEHSDIAHSDYYEPPDPDFKITGRHETKTHYSHQDSPHQDGPPLPPPLDRSKE